LLALQLAPTALHADYITSTLLASTDRASFEPYTGSPSGKASRQPIVTLEEFAAHSANIDLWLGDTYLPDSTPESTLAAIAAWVKAGGGLMMGGHTCECG
jgi:hypothetical protein